jgi:hypothetical protein
MIKRGRTRRKGREGENIHTQKCANTKIERVR